MKIEHLILIALSPLPILHSAQNKICFSSYDGSYNRKTNLLH